MFSYESAIAAAKISPETFENEFKKEGADANLIGIEGSFDKPLIFGIISSIDDARLPAILAILIEHNVNLKTKYSGEGGRTPIESAFLALKIEAACFLLSQKNIDTRGIAVIPELLHAQQVLGFNNKEKEIEKLNVILKSFIEEHKAEIDQKDVCGDTGLIFAARRGRIAHLNYLLSQGASLFAENTGKNSRNFGLTPIMAAYKSFDEEASKCIDSLIETAHKHLYRKVVQLNQEEKRTQQDIRASLQKEIEKLVGSYEDRTYKNHVKIQLEERLLQPVLDQYQRELAFVAGSLPPDKEHPAAPIHSAYFGSPILERQTVKMIFSFLQRGNDLLEEKTENVDASDLTPKPKGMW